MNINLEAIQTQKGNFFVFFHDYYGAYFTNDFSAFTENPVRVEAVKEWNWAKDNWKPEPETIELTLEQSEQVTALVESDEVDGIKNIRELVQESYLSV